MFGNFSWQKKQTEHPLAKERTIYSAMAKKTHRKCAACHSEEGPTWPVLTWNGLDLCFSCIEDMVHKMFLEPMGDQAAEHMLMHVRETHPWILPHPAGGLQ